jgi:hypothetical protein
MRMKSVAALTVIGLSSAALAGCGGSSSSGDRTTQAPQGPGLKAVTQKARPTPIESNPDIGRAGSQQSGARSSDSSASRSIDRVGPVHNQKAHPTPATTSDDQNTASSGPPDPCRLVSLTDAQTIAGNGITTRIEAPLGPTCIYERAGKKAAGITLAVQSTSFAQATHQLHKRKLVVVSGHHAYCGRLGTEVLLVPVGSDQVLNVTAPCGVAQQFAALAFHHLGA